MNDSPKDDRPGGGLVEGDVLVERDNIVQGCPTQEGDKIPAYREQDEGDVDVKNEGSNPSDSWGRKKMQLKKEMSETSPCLE